MPKTCNQLYLIGGKWANFAEHLDGALQLPHLHHPQLLIIRAVGDEAAGALVTAQFASWLTSRVWTGLTFLVSKAGLLTKPAEWVDLHTPDFRRMKFKTFVTFGLALLLWILFPVVLLQRDTAIIVVFMPFLILALLWIVQMLTLLLALVLLVFALAVACLLAPLIVLSFVLMLPFGPELALSNLLVEIVPEATPPGTWVVHLLEDDDYLRSARRYRVVSTLYHSIYEDNRAIRMVWEWIERVVEGS